MRKLPLEQLDALFRLVAKDKDLYLPVDDGKDGATWRKWQEGTVYSQACNTVRSAKDFFFPQTEDVAAFRMLGGKIQVTDRSGEKPDFVIFGCRACDVASFGILDSVFLADPVDVYYRDRRSHATIVSMGCVRPKATCFCTLYGIDATKAGADVDAWIEGDWVYLQDHTEKGAALLAGIASLLSDCDDQAVEAQRSRVKETLSRLPFGKLDLHRFGKDADMLAVFNDPAWEGLSQTCLGCGTCTFVCPTCQCFDIRDFDDGHGVQRYRCWDSCMYSDFTQMAAANPRRTQKERFRQRFMHKLVYFPEEHDGVYGCVGCGRCLERCPIHMHIVKVIQKLGEEA